MAKPNILLLHGAAGASSQFEPLLPLLSDHYHLHLLDFEGHGDTPPRERPFRIEHFAENTTDFLTLNGIERIDIFGYSLGGFVALYLARTRPELVNRVATLGTKLFWTRDVAAHEAKMFDPDQIERKAPHFAVVLAARHASQSWRTVLGRTHEMMTALGERSPLSFDDYAHIGCRVRVCVGDRDSTVDIEECHTVSGALPQGELEVFPNTPHPFEKVPLPRLAYTLTQFFR